MGSFAAVDEPVVGSIDIDLGAAVTPELDGAYVGTDFKHIEGGIHANAKIDLGKAAINFEAKAGGSINPLTGDVDAGGTASFNTAADLGDGYSATAEGSLSLTSDNGVSGLATGGVSYNNPSPAPTGDLQSFQVKAGAGSFGSDGKLCAAVRGDIKAGGKMTYAFARGAVGNCGEGLQASAEVGVGHNVGQYLPGDLPLNVEGGVRLGSSDVNPDNFKLGSTGGITPIVSVKLGF